MSQSDPVNSQTSAALTATQIRTLEVALEEGYFEVPRQVTLKDLAAELDCSHQTLSGRLRRATRALTEAVLTADPEAETQLWGSADLSHAKYVHQHPNCRKLVGGGSKPKPIERDAVDWHDLEPCPMCAGTRSFTLTSAGGAD